MKNKIFLLIQWTISISAFSYAVWNTNFSSALTKLNDFSLSFFFIAGLFLVLDYAFMGLRLQKLLTTKAPFSASMRATIICVGYNNLLPAKAGDILKIMFISSSLKKKISEITPIVVQERLYDLMLLAGTCLFVLPSAPLPLDTSMLLLILICIPCSIFLMIKFDKYIIMCIDKIPAHKPRMFCRNMFAMFLSGIDNVNCIKVFILTVLIWTFYFSSFTVCLLFVADLPLTLLQCAVVFCVTCMGMALPSSPGGLGIFEAALVLSLSWFNIPPDTALSIAIVMHCFYLIPISLIAVFMKKTEFNVQAIKL